MVMEAGPTHPGMLAMFKGTAPQVAAAVLGSISAISDGMQYGWSAPALPQLQAEDAPLRVSAAAGELLEVLYLAGSLAGLPITVLLVDRAGRHRAIMAAAAASLLAWLLMGAARTMAPLYAGRFVAGLAADVAFVAAPMYVAEIADQRIRGFLAGTIYLMMLVGVLIVYVVAPLAPLRAPALVGGALLLFQLAAFPFMPQSPFFLLASGRPAAARAALARLRGARDVGAELAALQAAVERQRAERGRPQDLVLVGSNRRAIEIVAVLNGAQHFGGISVVLMNLHTILEAADSAYMDPAAAAVAFSAIMLAAATLASFAVDRCGRRALLMLSCLASALCLSVLGGYFAAKDAGCRLNAVSWIPLACVMVYAAAFKLGLGIVPIVLTAELFPAKVKAMGMTLADSAYILFSLLSIALYQNLSRLFGIHAPLIVFALVTFAMAAYCKWRIPETKGKTLEEIQLQLKRQSKEIPTSNNNNNSDIV